MNESFSVEHACNFLDWMMSRLISEASGEGIETSDKRPEGRFWLGRLAPEVFVQNSPLGERAERLEPCATGIVVLWHSGIGAAVRCTVRARAWRRGANSDAWEKTAAVHESFALSIPRAIGDVTTAGGDQLRQAFSSVNVPGLSAEVRADLSLGKQGPELTLTVVNTTPDLDRHEDYNLYEVGLDVDMAATVPFILDDLPESFAYDRTVAAYGVNCGVEFAGPATLRTVDFVRVHRHRSDFWDSESCGPQPDFAFALLAENPIPPLQLLVNQMRQWGEEVWSEEMLARRAEQELWTGDMLERAREAADAFRSEVSRAHEGVELLRNQPHVLKAFQLMNAAFARTVGIAHKSWRPFQIGFLLTALHTLVDPKVDEVSILRFETGGGKTETYLGLLVTASFLDRMTGKLWGTTGWARFPLRMLSLQQTQRFADVFAAAELVRRDENLPGDSFSVGFFVGGSGTPNRIESEPRPGLPDYRDETMPAKYRILLNCPFCGSDQLEMKFSQDTWTLDHFCSRDACPWSGSLPFRIVDQEIYRFLPTVVVGTLDKAALVAYPVAIQGLYAAPYGTCPEGHGFTYAKRFKTPNGCLYPNCSAKPQALPQEAKRFPPTIRIQDELHLLRDSLGAVDSHYEALLDHLQKDCIPPRILASSATLAGYQEQVRALYRREAQLFPAMGPRASRSFWIVESSSPGRTFVGLAPRAVTLEYASDRINESLQRSVRWALECPEEAAHESGVPVATIPDLVSFYGVDVVYGSTLKDVEAAARSFETQMDLQPVNSVSLTGQTPLEDVRAAMARLDKPEEDFKNRIHLVAASSMLSHGVDIDRLNLMVMLGLPLSTAEFIQTTSRVGRSHPGLVFVLHKIGRERDAKVYRSFRQFVEQGDRLVDPVPITRRSRRVLELTLPALFLGRLYGFHEPAALSRGLKPLTTPINVRRAFEALPVLEDDEVQACIEALGMTGQLDEGLRADVAEYMRTVFTAIYSPDPSGEYTSDLLPRGPMSSLRDVEEQVPVFSRGGD